MGRTAVARNDLESTPPVEKRSQPHGGAIVTKGILGNRGRDGLGNEYRVWLASALKERRHQTAFLGVLRNPKHPQFIAATKHAAAYAHGLPLQSVVVADVTPPAPISEVLPRLVQALPALVAALQPAQAVRAQLVAAIQAAELPDGDTEPE